MNKIICAILCAAMVAATPVQAVPRAVQQRSYLMKVVYKRALAHMQSRAGISTGILALHGASVAMLLKSLCSSERPFSFRIVPNEDGLAALRGILAELMKVKPSLYLPLLYTVVAALVPSPFGIPLPKNGSDAEARKWLGRVHNVMARTFSLSAVNSLLLSAIAVRATYGLVQDGLEMARERLGADNYYDKIDIDLAAIDAPDEDGFWDTHEVIPECCICRRSTDTPQVSLSYCCTSKHIVHSACINEWNQGRYTTCPGAQGCRLAVRRNEPTLAKKLKWLSQVDQNFDFHFVTGAFVAVEFGLSRAVLLRFAYRR